MNRVQRNFVHRIGRVGKKEKEERNGDTLAGEGGGGRGGGGGKCHLLSDHLAVLSGSGTAGRSGEGTKFLTGVVMVSDLG